MALHSILLSLCSILFTFCRAQRMIHDDTALTSFVTRPEIRAPKFFVQTYHREHITPGYWFVAPYPSLIRAEPEHKWEACQIGAHIYDSDGNLVWSGACMLENRNVFDFKVININGKDHLSLLTRTGPDNALKGSGLILDNTYKVLHDVVVHNKSGGFNMHEFNVVNNGKSALTMTWDVETVDESDIGLIGQDSHIFTNRFRELNTTDSKELFVWNALDHIRLNESDFTWPTEPDKVGHGWDWLHMNSVDKTADGTYLASARYMNCIYLINGKSGDIIWRFGGKLSDFVLEGFNFSRQHDARFVSRNSTHTIVSFLDNASGESPQDRDKATSRWSTAYIVALHTSERPMRATVVQSYGRPDGRLTDRRGSVQLLNNGSSVFVGWSERGYQSEFTREGELVQDAHFFTDHFSTYRAYKFNFTAKPSEPPITKAFVYGATTTTITTVFYVSWNGATEVTSWNFWARKDDLSPLELVGNANKTGFETMFMHDGFAGWVQVEALDSTGHVIRRTAIVEVVMPENWRNSGFDLHEAIPDKMVHAPPPSAVSTPVYMPSSSMPAEEHGEPLSSTTSTNLIIIIFPALLVVCSFVTIATYLLRARPFQQYAAVPADELMDGKDGVFVERETHHTKLGSKAYR